MTETEIQKQIIDYLKLSGWDVYRMNSGRKGGVTLHKKGTPDLLAMKKGLTIWVEVKQLGKKPTDIQIRRHEEIRQNGFNVFISTSLKQFKEQLRGDVNDK